MKTLSIFYPFKNPLVCAGWLASFLAVLSGPVLGGIREPGFAGEFYPSAPLSLGQTIDRLLESAPEQDVPEEPAALIVPHAGYEYSGPVAAAGYRLLEGRSIDTVILIGPSHRHSFNGASVWQDGAWKTPLGEVRVDEDMAKAIAQENSRLDFDPQKHEGEHSLEVQIPFLQKTLKRFKIVPVLIGNPSLKNARVLARAILKQTAGKKVLVVVSTDWSHFYPEAVAREKDQRGLDLLVSGDAAAFAKEADKKKIELCGLGGVLTAMELAGLKGGSKIRVLKYATSGEMTGDKNQVVGYAAAVIYQPGSASKSAGETGRNPEGFLNDGQQKRLLEIARKTLAEYLDGKPAPEFIIADPALVKKQGAFVTLWMNGRLRGCIGETEAVTPLADVVRQMAIASATQDPRFSPLTRAELDKVKIEISVLTLPRRVGNPDSIVMGRHGVIVERGGARGLFLPQVAEQLGKNKKRFLSTLCAEKAGLAPDCWQDPDTRLYVFEAQVFDEGKR